jgi:hypothetical protein
MKSEAGQVMGDNREDLIAASQRTYFRSKVERDLL